MPITYITPGDDIKTSRFMQGCTTVFRAGQHVVKVDEKACAAYLASNCTVTGEPGAIIKVVGDGTLFAAVCQRSIRIENLTIKHATTKQVANYSSTFNFRGCDGVYVGSTKVLGAGASAIVACRNSADVDGRPFDNIGEGYWPTRNLFVYKCEFVDCVGPVIGFKSGGAEHVVISNCTFRGFGTYAISAESEGAPHGHVTDVLIADNDISHGDTSFRGDTVGPIFGVAITERAIGNIRIVRNRIAGIGGESASYAAGILLSTSPSQSDLPVSDVTIEDNVIESIKSIRFGRGAGIQVSVGRSSVRGLSIFRNAIGTDKMSRLTYIRPNTLLVGGTVSHVQTDEVPSLYL